MEISPQTQRFIDEHADGDVRQLALNARRDDGLDLAFALDQIAGRQAARRKLPSWAAADGIVYPPHLAMEQCSSEATATAKTQLAVELFQRIGAGSGPRSMVDLTGGFGVDFSFLARGCAGQATYVERQEGLCEIARHNFAALGLERAQVVNADAVETLRAMEPVDLIYVDPARRSETSGARTYAIEDCTPNVLALRDELLAKAQVVMIKLSPMLDWRKAAADFGDATACVGIIAAGGECKELVLLLTRNATTSPQVVAIADGERFAFTADASSPRGAGLSSPALEAGMALFEPNAALMKAGCFDLLEQRTGARQIAPNSHLFVADGPLDFPGRAFTIDSVGTLNKKSLRRQFSGVGRANVAVRNFPLSAPQLRSRLNVKDGGDLYVFGTTDAAGNHVVIGAHKAHPAPPARS